MNISTKTKPVIPYQEKIIKNINSTLDEIHPEFKQLNPILSGTYLINLVVSPFSEHTDYDFYFETTENYLKADALLTEVSISRYQSKNCISFNLKKQAKQVQLIKSYHGSAIEIIAKHDLVNSQVAYLNENIYFTTSFIRAWMHDTLELNTFQVSAEMSPKEKLLKYSSTVLRIRKYLERYNLSLSEQTQVSLRKLKTELIENYSTDASLVGLQKKDMHYNYQDIKVTVLSQLILIIENLITNEEGMGEVIPF